MAEGSRAPAPALARGGREGCVVRSAFSRRSASSKAHLKSEAAHTVRDPGFASQERNGGRPGLRWSGASFCTRNGSGKQSCTEGAPSHHDFEGCLGNEDTQAAAQTQLTMSHVALLLNHYCKKCSHCRQSSSHTLNKGLGFQLPSRGSIMGCASDGSACQRMVGGGNFMRGSPAWPREAPPPPAPDAHSL